MAMDEPEGTASGSATGAGGRHAFDPAAAWSDGVITPAEGARFVADLGFELVHGDRPDRPAGANLIVAFRETPSLHHFDPETLTYWSAEGGRGVRRVLDWTSPPPDRPAAWGAVVVTDRLAVSNTFLTFGGALRMAGTDPATRIAVLGSPAPIMRWGGHSQGKDVRADEVGAFFGRLRAAVGADVEAEGRVLAAPPLVLYAALIADARARIAEHHALGDARPGFDAWSLEEQHRLDAVAPDVLDAGRGLLATLGIDAGG
jgi:hypothetical protein